MQQLDESGQTGALSENDVAFLRGLGLDSRAIDVTSPLLVGLLKGSKRFQDAFAELHQAFQRRDDFTVR